MRRTPWLLALVLLAAHHASAQSTRWDSILTDSNWYVPTGNMLAYASSNTSFADPQAIGDQTLWNIGTADHGVFTGTSAAKLGFDGVTTSTEYSTMQGIVTDSGQIRITFTSDTAVTLGIGQMREVEDITYMEMQMITGTTLLVTHWAYMAPYDPETFTPPGPSIGDDVRSPDWRWMLGTEWALSDDTLFGTTDPGTFTIAGYHNGYFWGSGTAPEGSTTGDFTLLGSATPEGNILFNTIADGVMTSLTGQITGDAITGAMALRNYEGGELTTTAAATVIPEPHTYLLLLAAIAFLLAKPTFAAIQHRTTPLQAPANRLEGRGVSP